MILILSILFVILYPVLWGLRDVAIIRNDKGYNNYSKRWHVLGLLQVALVMLPIYYLNPSIPFILGSIVIIWQLHDSVIGYGLYKNPFYLGNNGFDKWLNQVFQSGRTLFVIRMGILLCCVLAYLRNFNN